MSATNDTNNAEGATSGSRSLTSTLTPLSKRGGQENQTTTPDSGTPTGGGRAPDGSVLYGRAQPLQIPPSMLQSAAPAQKRKSAPDPAEDGEDDHDMLGKDIPTLFKRQRNRHDNPYAEGDALDNVSFAPAYPRIFMLDGVVPGGFPSLTLGGGGQTLSIGNLPLFRAGYIQPASSSEGPSEARVVEKGEGSSRPKKSTNPSRARRSTPSRRTSRAPDSEPDSGDETDPVVDEQTGMNLALAALRRGKTGAKPTRKRVRLSVPPTSSQDPPTRESSAQPTTEPETPTPTTIPSRKTAQPASQPPPPDDESSTEDQMATDPPEPLADKGKGRADTASGFVTRAELGDIQYSLRQLNNNVGRLVVLMSEQTQFFSTMQARGWRGSTAQAEQTDDEFDEPRRDVAAATEKLKRRAAHDPKPTELPTSRDPAHNALAARIRSATRKLMGRRTSKDPFLTEHIASDTEAEEYNPEQGPACGLGDFRPDLAGTPSNPWNASVVQTFITHFMSKEPDADEDKVTELFETHLKYLCTRYKESLLGEQALRRRQRLANRAERQRNLWIRRLTVAAFHSDLQIHIPVLRALGPHGMSSDESDHESGGHIRYRILRKPWRNPNLAPWLRLFDRLYSVWRLGNMTGAHPHPRHPSNVVSTRRPPVRGLPWNAYNQAWFEKLTDFDKTILVPQMGVEYDFTHSTALRSEAGAI